MAKIIMLCPGKDSHPASQATKEACRNLPDLTVVGTDTGLEEVTKYYQVEYHIGFMLDKAVEIEKRHDCDAIITGCFGDPGLLPLRQAISIPVLGIAEVCLNVAAMLGDKIAIIAPQRDWVYVFEKMIHTYQFSDRVVAVRSVGELDIESLQKHPDKFVDSLVDSLADACLRAIHEDNADVVIPGCVGFFPSVVHQVRELIAKKGFRTPIIDCVTTAYHAAKMIVELGLNQDRRKL